MIQVNNVTLRRNNKTILKNVSWSEKKESIVSENNSLNVINGYLWPSEGKVQVLGHTFGKTNLPDRDCIVNFL